ncbi:hypothetical protein TraAM80_07465 [Trypanosoma rangeli]|uniref:Uncharacterized protein n=1 Tax=Trypanosoma rangeli TaxID=5698 RepID=A0A422N5I4_TRYRA|nr:uncharacterized protein TraAM80_07465 [Trypanosoma rangeli]RNF00691.1 hypothetical protein TraAM80_07465 [Trypanosoma rangeli]|eukprot:RNF00691.1 hypothetical protein TraAM80_07465 [Trypanosoma rangeli]
MFEPLRVERVPTRIQAREECIAFATHPNPASCVFNWGCCTVTRKLDLVFHSAHDVSSRLRLPGAREKKKAPYFFRFACSPAASVFEYPIQPTQVMDSAFSECSSVTVEPGERTCAAAQHLPTVAMLLCASRIEVNLLILRPVLRVKGNKVVICYTTLFLPAPEDARHVLVSRCGGAVFLLASHVSGPGGRIQCYSLRIDGNQQRTPSLRTTPLIASMSSSGTVPAAASMVGCNQCILWASVRRPLCLVASTSQVILAEVMVLTDDGATMVFQVSLGDDTAGVHATCVWLGSLRQNKFRDDAHVPLGVMQRWRTTPFFARAMDEANTPEASLEGNLTTHVRQFLSAIPIVSVSPNGALLCVVLPNEHKVWLVALGSNAKAFSTAACASTSVGTPSSVTMCDVSWVAGSLCGFLLLGVSKQRDGMKAMLFFLPLTGHHAPLRIYLDPCHASCLASDDGAFSFFSYEPSRDVFGTTRMSLSLYYRSGRCEEENMDEVRTGLFSLPTMASLTSTCAPSHVLHIIYFTGLVSFATACNEIPSASSAGYTARDALGGEEGVVVQSIPSIFAADDAVQMSMEAALESSLDLWLQAGAVDSTFPLRRVTHEIIQSLLEGINNSRGVSVASQNGKGGSYAALLSVFRALADVLASVSVTSASVTLLPYLSELHGLLVMLRHALTVMGQRGAVSACFTAAAFFAPLADENDTGDSHCPEWRALLAPLFDDAFAHVASCPSLSHALLPYCSTALRRVMSTGESLLLRERQWELTTSVPRVTVDHNGEVVRPLEETLSLARRGSSGLAMLSSSDVCWSARRLFFRDGVNAAQSFLKAAVGHHDQIHPEVRAVCGEYDLVQKELAAVLNYI